MSFINGLSRLMDRLSLSHQINGNLTQIRLITIGTLIRMEPQKLLKRVERTKRNKKKQHVPSPADSEDIDDRHDVDDIEAYIAAKIVMDDHDPDD